MRTIELPAYSTLDRLADRAHAAADRRLFGWVMRHIPEQLEQRVRTEKLVETLDAMLDVLYSQEDALTAAHRIKKLVGNQEAHRGTSG